MKEWPIGSEPNPMPVSETYQYNGASIDFGDRPHVWVVKPDGQKVKVYRSYSDYCDN